MDQFSENYSRPSSKSLISFANFLMYADFGAREARAWQTEARFDVVIVVSSKESAFVTVGMFA